MITLLPDQEELMQSVRRSMMRHKSILLQAATGSGKTVMASWLVASAQAKGNSCWFTVPRKELIVQTGKTFDGFGVPHSHIAAGYVTNPYSKSHICSIGTLVRRLDKFKPPRLAIIDEAHYAGAAVESIIEWLKDNGSWVIGLSATPWKLSGVGLGRWYEDMICGPSIRWLIDNKRLSDYRLFAPNRPDLSGIKTVAGDYAKGQLADRMEHDTVLIGDAVKYYKEHAMGSLGVTYCASRKHSKMTAEKYNESGVPAAYIDGETPDIERRRLIRAFANREILQLCNAQLLTFGFDLAAQVGRDITVETMTDLSPTKSLSLQMQKWGRVLRYKDKPAMILDHASNIHTHGLPCSDRTWCLSDRHTPGSAQDSGERTIAVRTCTKCFHSHKPAPKCPECGHEYPIRHREIEEIDGELDEISITRPRAPSPSDLAAMQHAIDSLTESAVKKGMPRWRATQWAAKKITQQLARR